jgi:hypothetical protein
MGGFSLPRHGERLERREETASPALGRLGWSLRRIEQATGVRRETVSSYLQAAGIPVLSYAIFRTRLI